MRDLPIEIPPAARKFKSFRLSQRLQEKPLKTFHNDPNYVSDSQGSQESQESKETQVSQESKESQSKSLTSQESKLSRDSELEKKLATGDSFLHFRADFELDVDTCDSFCCF